MDELKQLKKLEKKTKAKLCIKNKKLLREEQVLDEYWKEELNDPESIFYHHKIVEEEIKEKVRRGWLIKKIARSMKKSVELTGGYSYSQESLANHFKTTKESVRKTLKILEPILGVGYLIVSTKGLKMKVPYRRFLMPPKLVKFLNEKIQEESKKREKNMKKNLKKKQLFITSFKLKDICQFIGVSFI